MVNKEDLAGEACLRPYDSSHNWVTAVGVDNKQLITDNQPLEAKLTSDS
jgi:hypothetical protein